MEIIQSAVQPERAVRKTSETMDADLSKMGNNLVTKFHVLMRISQIYDSKNVALKQFTQESLQAINAMIQQAGDPLPEDREERPLS